MINANVIKESHLIIKEGRKITRNNRDSYAHPINEIKFSSSIFDNVMQRKQRMRLINNVINFLNVEHSLRYQPKASLTYCNVYAYDLIKLLGAYIPRVWWTSDAINSIRNGDDVVPRWGETVEEYNTRMIYDWFLTFGEQFNWLKARDYQDLKFTIRKSGTIGIVISKFNNNTGHISLVYMKNIKKIPYLFKPIGQTDAGRECHVF